MGPGQLPDAIRQLFRSSGQPAPEAPTDAELIRLYVGQHNDEAFALLVRRHGPLVLRVCRRLLVDVNDAEDAFQATFLVLVRKAASLSRREMLSSWLYGVAFRVAARARTTRQRQLSQVSLDPESLPGDNPDEALRADLRAVVHEEVARLPDRYRRAVVLCYLQEKTIDQAAQELGCPRGTVSVRLARARDLLYGRLARRGLNVSSFSLPAALSLGSPFTVLPQTLTAATEAALCFAAGPGLAGTLSPQVLALAEGVLKTMVVSKLKFTLGIAALLLGALGTGYVVAESLAERSPARAGADTERSAPTPPRTVERQPAAGAEKPKKDDPAPPAKPDKPAPVADKGDEVIKTLEAETKAQQLVGISADGTTLYSWGGGEITSWDVKTGNANYTFEIGSQDVFVYPLVVAPDGKSLVIATNKQADVWDLTANPPTKTRTLTWPAPAEDPDTGKKIGAHVNLVLVSADCTRSLTRMSDGDILLWDLTTGKQLSTLKNPLARSTPLALSPDGKQIALLIKGAPHIWDAQTGKELKSIPVKKGPQGEPNRLLFSGDGKTLMAVRHDKSTLWNLDTKKEYGPIKTPDNFQRSLALSHDGKRLAVASAKEKVKIVDVVTGKDIVTYNWISPTHGMSCVVLSKDGKTVASTRHPRVRLWKVPQPVAKK